jgi:hypothetical protein
MVSDMAKKGNKRSSRFLSHKFLDKQVIVNTGAGYKKGRCTKTADGLIMGYLEDGTEYCVSCKKVLLA